MQNDTASQLLALPNEILLHIIEDLLGHDDLEHFCRCCRYIHHLSKSALALHLARKQKYGTLVVGDVVYRPFNDDTVSFLYPVHFLADHLEEDPYIFTYVRTAIIGRYQPGLLDQAKKDGTRRFHQQIYSYIRGLAPNSPAYDYPHHSLDDSISLYRPRLPNYEFTFLSLCPWLEKLEVLDGHVQALNDGLRDQIYIRLCFPRLAWVFDNLQEVSLYARVGQPLQFHTQLNFATLPKLHTLRSFSISSRRHGSRVVSTGFKGNIRHYHFVNSIIIASDLTILLQSQNSNCLQSFTCELKGSGYMLFSELAQWTLIIDTLRHFASESLESLNLSMPWPHGASEINVSSFESLGTFTRLKHLRLECRYLMYLDAPDFDLDTSIERGLPNTMSCIRHLPLSLKTLELVVRSHTNRELRWLKSGIKLISKALPHVESISVREPRPRGK
ncbi:MAG: hypothetical protein Q9170_002066 [Blastenia crenularia]